MNNHQKFKIELDEDEYYEFLSWKRTLSPLAIVTKYPCEFCNRPSYNVIKHITHLEIDNTLKEAVNRLQEENKELQFQIYKFEYDNCEKIIEPEKKRLFGIF